MSLPQIRLTITADRNASPAPEVSTQSTFTGETSQKRSPRKPILPFSPRVMITHPQPNLSLACWASPLYGKFLPGGQSADNCRLGLVDDKVIGAVQFPYRLQRNRTEIYNCGHPTILCFPQTGQHQLFPNLKASVEITCRLETLDFPAPLPEPSMPGWRILRKQSDYSHPFLRYGYPGPS